MKITICGSMVNYGRFVDLKQRLELAGHMVVLPEPTTCAGREKINKGCYVDTYKLKIKYDYIRKHFANILLSDCILVANYRKDDVDNYIGGDSFLEIGFAYFINKPIYLLNPIPKIKYYYHEIKAMRPVVLDGDLGRLH